MSKPVLDKVAVGDELLVIPTSYSRRPVDPIKAVVTKVGRVWIELDQSEPRGYRTWRLRLDTQHDGSDSNYRTRFVTAEQYAYEQRGTAVYEYLREQGIQLRMDSPWDTEERRLVLVNLLRRHDGLPEL